MECDGQGMILQVVINGLFSLLGLIVLDHQAHLAVAETSAWFTLVIVTFGVAIATRYVVRDDSRWLPGLLILSVVLVVGCSTFPLIWRVMDTFDVLVILTMILVANMWHVRCQIKVDTPS